MNKILTECKKYTKDPFWIDVFDQCSLGKFPKGVRPTKDGNIIIYDPDGKGDKDLIRLAGLDEKETFTSLVDIFRNKLGMFSDLDIEQQKREMQEIEDDHMDNTEYASWKQIKQKKVRNNLIIDFVLDKKNTFNLTKQETNELLSAIRIGFIFKTLTSNDVNFYDGKIHEIRGLDFDENGKYQLDIYSGNVSKRVEAEVDKLPIYFERYVKEYKNFCIKL